MEEKEFITHSTPLRQAQGRSVFTTRSARETEDLGSKLAHNFKTGDIILLHGELGAGKTTFVQGVGKALNVKSRIISPTFVLVRKHKARIKNPIRQAPLDKARGRQVKHESRILNLYHIDLYRLENSDEIKDLGLEDIFEDPNAIFFIEWGEKHENLKASFEINFEILRRDRRRITLRNPL